jgi:hypothetical protein
MVSDRFKPIFFGVSSILIFLVTHEFVHGYVAAEYGCNVSYSLIPNSENFFTTSWSSCTGNTATVRFLQSIVEIVGYQLFILHSLVTGYVAVQINRDV